MSPGAQSAITIKNTTLVVRSSPSVVSGRPSRLGSEAPRLTRALAELEVEPEHDEFLRDLDAAFEEIIAEENRKLEQKMKNN